MLLALAGCGQKNHLNEQDKLRRQNLELQREVEKLQKRLEQQAGEVRALRQRVHGPAATQAGVTPPQLSTIELGRYSGPIDSDGDGRDDVLRLYLRPLDQEGRMMPVAGRCRVQVVHIPETGEPKRLTARTYKPDGFNEAYRSSFTGEHYTLELPLPKDLPADVEQITVKVSFEQLPENVTLTAQQAYRISRGE